MGATTCRFGYVATAMAALWLAVAPATGTQGADKQWLAQWEARNKSWIALHLIGPVPEKLDITERLISEVLAPMGINVLILEVCYGFQYQSHPELSSGGL
ncbi:MAG TPA: hypothetical protein EYH34_10945, partial [Planctomycetes bacterium]|nr:hypothetical protein [Planctomycetota bacterium]